MNEVKLSGNLTRDPEVRFTAKGTAKCIFTLAHNTGKGEQKKAHFFDCVAWKGLAEEISERFKKGSAVEIMGMLTQNQWTTDDGQKRSRVEIVVFKADAIEFKKQEPPQDDPDDVPF